MQVAGVALQSRVTSIARNSAAFSSGSYARCCASSRGDWRLSVSRESATPTNSERAIGKSLRG
jgi:hypothetical protein